MARTKGREITYEDLERRQREAKSLGYDSIFAKDIPVFTPKEGDATIRILKPEDSDHPFGGKDIFVHYGIGGDEGQYLCLDPTKNPDSEHKHCPICEAAADAARDGDQDTAKELRAGGRLAVWVLDRDSDKEEPMIYSMPRKVERNVIDLMKNKKLKKAVPICDWDEGHDVFFTRVGTSLNTDYSGYQRDPDPTPVCDDQTTQDEVQDFIEENPIASFLNFYEPKYLQRLLEGTMPEGDEALDGENETGTRDRGRRGDRGGRDTAEAGTRRASRDRSAGDGASDRSGRRGRGGDADTGGENDSAEETNTGRRGRGSAEGATDRRGRGRAAPEETPAEPDEGAGEADASAERGERRRVGRGRAAPEETPAEPERSGRRGGRTEPEGRSRGGRSGGGRGGRAAVPARGRKGRGR